MEHLNENRETQETWNSSAKLYQEKFMDLTIYDASYFLFCQQFSQKNPSILEVGCGPGNVTKALKNLRDDFEITAFDYAPNMIELAQMNVPNCKFQVKDVRKIAEFKPYFDGIISGFCLPYLNPKEFSQFLKDAHNLMQSRGWMYFSLVEAKENKSTMLTGSHGLRTKFFHYSREWVIDELVQSGFVVEEIMEVLDPSSSSEFHTIYLAQKGK